MRKIGIYRTVFPIVSETFIEEQAANLTQFEPIFLIRSKLREMKFQHVAISDRDSARLKQISFWLTRNSSSFGNPQVFSQLELVHAHFAADGVYVMPLVEKLSLPLIVTLHGYEAEIYRNQIQNFWKLGRQLKYQSVQLLAQEANLQKRASAFITVSRFIANKVIAGGYPKEKIILHYIGVDVEKFFPATEPSNERYILCVGRHVPKKGIDTLLKAFARIAHKHPTVSLIQVGAGELTPDLHALTEQLGISSRVQFLGAQPHQKVLQLMQHAEIFSLPSQTGACGDYEALGMVFNEASACGIPIVSTLHGGIPEAVIDGETGFLVPERDDFRLAERLDTLLSDRALGQKMGQQGREYVGEVFNVRKQAATLEKIYAEAIAKWRETH